jgi:hypothetical protein
MPTMTDHQQVIDIAETALGWIGDQALLRSFSYQSRAVPPQ